MWIFLKVFIYSKSSNKDYFLVNSHLTSNIWLMRTMISKIVLLAKGVGGGVCVRVSMCVVGHMLDIWYDKMGNWAGLDIKAILSICSLGEFLSTAFPFSLVAIWNFYLFLLIASAHHQLHHPVNYLCLTQFQVRVFNGSEDRNIPLSTPPF